jgi:uncharacterized protein YbjT (DUF2867 family)
MIILLTGASGFIGRRLVEALVHEGHTVIAAGRHPAPGAQRFIAADFTQDVAPEVWIPRLVGVEVVINAVGILRETGGQTFVKIHTRAPQALFEACSMAGVERVVQVSALGADSGTSGYFRSKHSADAFLRTLPLDWTIVQPALVYGPDGTSARLFTTLASLPVIPVPGRGDQHVQPIHIDDVIAAVIAIVAQRTAVRQTVPLVGPEPVPFAQFLRRLRDAMGLRPARVLPMPMLLMRAAAAIGSVIPGALLDRDTLDMLAAGNTADAAATTRILRRAPRPIESFVPAQARLAAAHEAKLRWLLPALRISIAFVWIWTAIVSIWLYPREHSLELLYRVGVPEALAPSMLYGAAGLDLIFGVATLALRGRRWLWPAQMGLIVGYTIIITLKLPEFWLHPYGPIVKNLPMLAALYLLYVLEEPQWST